MIRKKRAACIVAFAMGGFMVAASCGEPAGSVDGYPAESTTSAVSDASTGDDVSDGVAVGDGVVAGSGSEQDLLLVSGSLNHGDGSVTIETASAFSTVKPADAGSGPFDLVGFGPDGEELYRVSFSLDLIEDDEDDVSLFQVTLQPYEAGSLARLAIFDGGNEIGSREASGADLTFILEIGPTGPVPLSGLVVGVQPSEPDPSLRYTAFFSPDGGETWRGLPAAPELEGGQLQLGTAADLVLNPTETARIRLIASDGVNSHYQDSDTFTLIDG